MNLKAIIPQGQTEITVNGLHQWDYGQKLEIHSADFPAVVEVHFACVGMTSAVVRVCEFVNGVATAAIPDQCLEQTTPIVAWVFEINGTTGTTTCKIILPIEARTRPEVAPTLPTEISDRYTELLTLVNSVEGTIKTATENAVKEATAGNIKVKSAEQADNATNAGHATTAGSAATAGSATLATVLENDWVHVKSETSGEVEAELCAGVYLVWNSTTDRSPKLFYVSPAERYGHVVLETSNLAGYDIYRYSLEFMNEKLTRVLEYRNTGGFELNTEVADSIDCYYMCIMQFAS